MIPVCFFTPDEGGSLSPASRSRSELSWAVTGRGNRLDDFDFVILDFPDAVFGLVKDAILVYFEQPAGRHGGRCDSRNLLYNKGYQKIIEKNLKNGKNLI